MRVRCVQRELSVDQLVMLGLSRAYQDFHVTIGKEYLVVGLDFFVGSRAFGTGTWLQVVSDYGRLGWVPLCLFQMTDGRVSKHWVARNSTDGLSLWPPTLYREFFHDDLSEDQPEALADLQRTLAELEAEATSTV